MKRWLYILLPLLSLTQACIESGVRPGAIDWGAPSNDAGDPLKGDISALDLPIAPPNACIPQNGGIEICDNIDNNCDGKTDEGYDFEVNTNHCGACGLNCAFDNAFGLCLDGLCALGDCFQGWSDLDENTENGCEIPCEISHGGVEVCDKIDNDCDGEIDELFDFLSDPENCGDCGRNCLLPKVVEASCAEGDCAIKSCEPGWTDEDENPLTGCESNCIPSGDGIEICDYIDNDCNGITDDGFDLINDLNNCGACGLSCSFNNGYGLCLDNVCLLTGCEPGQVDQDNDPSNGCEEECSEGESGIELCDGIDNDCDGNVDESFKNALGVYNVQLSHCGECNQLCSFPNASVECSSEGECQLTGCLIGWFNFNGDPTDGCEYPCIPTGQELDLCNLLDDDCDGSVDEDATAEGVCYPFATGCIQAEPSGEWLCKGQCTAGVMSCVGGLTQCAEHVGPEPELCDGIDNDCDGGIDEGFNFDSDPAHCGSCDGNCFDNAPENTQVSGCISGNCVWTCLSGFSNLDGNMQSNGCEYACAGSAPDGTEICDGIDNDCDGQIDESSDLLPPPPNLCANIPDTLCASSTPSCTSTIDETFYSCNYPGGVETVLGNPNQIIAEETVCDGIDGDCDGITDEGFMPLIGSPCQGEGIGQCAPTGTYQCKADGTGTECVITNPAAEPSAELCDAIDNDCDGLTDESASIDSNGNSLINNLVWVNSQGIEVWVHPYEASHPDASAITTGLLENVACAKPGVLPWIGATFAQAQNACQGAGLRLCTPAEWSAICAGASNQKYPYGNTYQSNHCNGLDKGLAEVDLTGASTDCSRSYNDQPIFDLSGNVKEWVNDGATSGFHQVRGGSYLSPDIGLSCDFDFALSGASLTSPTVGFRCCKSP